jgi:hypothetical protein
MTAQAQGPPASMEVEEQGIPPHLPSMKLSILNFLLIMTAVAASHGEGYLAYCGKKDGV